jgi:hypothetical protein
MAITVPNLGQGAATSGDGEDDLVDEDDEDDNAAQNEPTAFNPTILTDPLATSQHSLTAPNQLYHHALDSQQEAICMEALSLEPLGFSTFEVVYDLNDSNTSNQAIQLHSMWTPQPNGTAATPMMHHSFSAPAGW